MGAQVALSVVLPARDAASTIEDQLAALARQADDPRWELVVVVDALTHDQTEAIANRWRDRLPQLEVVRAPASGVGHCRNFGVRSSSGGVVGFCDADDVVSARWTAGLVAALEHAELVTGPIDLSELNPRYLYGWRRTTGWPGPPPRWLGFLPPIMGCNMAVTRAIFDRVGGFDESLAPGEDFDFAWRAQLAGATVGFSPEAVVHRRLRRGWPAFKASVSYGMSDVQLYRRFAEHGLPPRRLRGIVRAIGVILALPLCLSPRYRYGWMHLAGVETGRVLGSVRERVLYL